MELKNSEKDLGKAQDFAEFIGQEVKRRGLTLFEVSMALQSIEQSSLEHYGDAWRAAWSLAMRVWSKGRSFGGRSG